MLKQFVIDLTDKLNKRIFVKNNCMAIKRDGLASTGPECNQIELCVLFELIVYSDITSKVNRQKFC